MLCHLVLTSNTNVHSSLANKGWDVRSRQENKRDREVLHECDVKSGMTVELNVGAEKQVEACLIEPSLYIFRSAIGREGIQEEQEEDKGIVRMRGGGRLAVGLGTIPKASHAFFSSLGICCSCAAESGSQAARVMHAARAPTSEVPTSKSIRRLAS
ncbi:hypothetical protein M8818_001696 [Zalaria obscura]|uniref:Uncharacterized protein n=1 Tax=Zalaria obscura TaxID=2024903 RepID=A0ACC3SJM1_9PEZI